MDRSLVQAKQSRSGTSQLARIAATVAKTATQSSVESVRALCAVPMPRHMRRRVSLGGPGTVPLLRACVRISAAGGARNMPLSAVGVHRAGTNNDTQRSFNR